VEAKSVPTSHKGLIGVRPVLTARALLAARRNECGAIINLVDVSGGHSGRNSRVSWAGTTLAKQPGGLMSLIVVGLDSSPRAPAVLARASAMARSSGAKLLVVRAVGLPHDLAPDMYGVSPDALPDRLAEAARKDLLALTAAHCAGV
jgi:hypothetical protein